MPINYKDYPPNWTSEIRPRILERDGHCCKFCKVPNREWIFRGYLEHGGLEIYQKGTGLIHDAYSGELLCKDYFILIIPLTGDPNQKSIQVVLTIAHLDHDADNWDVKDDRLAALCQRCHLRYDAPHKKAKRAEKQYKDSLFPL